MNFNLSSLKAHTVFFMVILIITVIVMWKCYWRIQVMYNSSTLSLYTPDSFYISPQHRPNHDKITKYGFIRMQKKTVVICALLRDVASKLKEIRLRAERLGKAFKDYRIIIVENDSSDGTRAALKKWRKDNPKVIILGCGVNSEINNCRLPKAGTKTEGHTVNRKRIEKMTHLRNIYLDYVKNSLREYDYAVVWDMDIVGTVYLDGIANTIGHFEHSKSLSKDADAICAYGIYRWGWVTLYYDTYAHIDKGDRFHIDLKTVHDLKKGLRVRYERGTPPVPVVSCFSGFTIYRISSLLDPNVIYDMSPPDNLECEHVRFHRKLHSMYLNPSMIHFVLLND